MIHVTRRESFPIYAFLLSVPGLRAISALANYDVEYDGDFGDAWDDFWDEGDDPLDEWDGGEDSWEDESDNWHESGDFEGPEHDFGSLLSSREKAATQYHLVDFDWSEFEDDLDKDLNLPEKGEWAKAYEALDLTSDALGYFETSIELVDFTLDLGPYAGEAAGALGKLGTTFGVGAFGLGVVAKMESGSSAKRAFVEQTLETVYGPFETARAVGEYLLDRAVELIEPHYRDLDRAITELYLGKDQGSTFPRY